MKYSFLALLWMVLVCWACGQPPTQDVRPVAREEAGQDQQLQTRLAAIFKGYIQAYGNYPLQTKWEKDGTPVIDGKAGYVQMLRNSNDFTPGFCDMVATYLDRCESEGAKDPGMERFECIDYDLVLHEPFSKLVEIRDLRMQGNGDRKEVELVLVGSYRSAIDPARPTVAESRLSFSVLAKDGVWRIDRAYTTMGYMVNWGLKWQ